MALDAVANFVRGTTDAALDNTATTVSVTDATIFPDPGTQGEYNVVIWDAESFPRPDQDPSVEILRVTARDTGTDELTVTRGQEGTSGASHPSGSAVHLSPTAKMFSDIESRYTAAGEDFDGQGTSDFTNLQSVSTENATIGNSLGVTGASIEGASSSTTIQTYRDSVADGSTVNIVDENNPIGTVVIDDKSGGGVALVALQGSLDNTAILADASGDFSTTQGNAGTVNVYHDGSNYVAENQTTGSVTLSRWLIA